MASCIEGFYRCILVTVNSLFLINCIIAISAISIRILSEDSKIIVKENIFLIIIIYLITHAIISFLGICGASSRNDCMLRGYAISNGIMLLLFFIMFLVLIFSRKLIQDFLAQKIYNAAKLYQYDDIFSSKNEEIDLVQYNFKCCGGYNYTDYVTLPVTCCGKLPATTVSPYDYIVDLNVCHINDAYKTGCGESLTNFLFSYSFTAFYLICFLIEILMILAAIHLLRLSNHYEIV